MKKSILLLFAAMSISPYQVFAEDSQSAELTSASYIKEDVVNYQKITDRLATSGELSDGTYTKLSKDGIKTFVDLRTDPEEIKKAKEEAEKAGAIYISIPVNGSEGILKEQVEKFTKVFENNDDSVLLSCKSGNRAGSLWTAYQLSKGTPLYEATKQGHKAGMSDYFEENVKKNFCKEC